MYPGTINAEPSLTQPCFQAYIHKSDIYVFREGHYNEKARLSTTRLSPSVGGAAFHSVSPYMLPWSRTTN